MLTAAMLAGIEHAQEAQPQARDAGSPDRAAGLRQSPAAGTRWVLAAHAAFAVVGVLVAAALGWGLWTSRNMPYVDDIGTLLAHRGVGDYSLSMSHFFDLTGASFAALRLPAALAAGALLAGPLAGLILRFARLNIPATVSVALTAAVFLIAAHIAFARFEPMLSSKQLADTILQDGSPSDDFIVFGDQSDASSVIFYTHRFFGHPALLVHGAQSSMLWGSMYPDAPKIFLSEDQLAARWGHGNRHWLFAQDTNRAKVEQLLANRLIPAQTIADKTLWTDKPLEGIDRSQPNGTPADGTQ
jgi:hypothetical protein